jgi:hypothetical protein
MRALLLATAALAAIPAVAGAQDATERRRAQAYENLRQLEQSQRIGEVERQLDNIEIRRQSEAALRALQPPPRNRTVDAPYVVAGSSAATGVPALQPSRPPGEAVLEPYAGPTTTTGAATAEDRLRDAELAATNARLREIAQAQRGN